MAKKQSRRSVSMSIAVFDALTAEAAKRGLTTSHYLGTLIREAIPGIPETHYMTVADTAKAKQSKAEKTIAEVYKAVASSHPLSGPLGTDEREGSKRRRSIAAAVELRKHGLLEREGYASGSWSSK